MGGRVSGGAGGPEGTRVVALLGPPGSGKSTLAAALARAAGPPPPAPPGGALGHGALGHGTLGHRTLGHRKLRHRKLGHGTLGHGALLHRGVHVALLDPPGAPDLRAQACAALRVASAVLLVLSPAQGVDARTLALWHDAERAELPRLVVLTQLDRPGADADEAVAVCRRVLGETVLPLQLPLHDDDGAVAGLLDLLALEVSEPAGHRPAEPEHRSLVAGLRDELLEAVLTGSEDDDAFDLLTSGDVPPEVLARELPAAVARGDLQPVAVAVPPRGVGVADLLDLLVTALPDATTRAAPAAVTPSGEPLPPLPPDVGGPLAAEVVRGGSATLVRVWSGSLSPGSLVLVGGRGPQLYDGAESGPGRVVEAALVGRPGDTVCAPDEPLALEPWALPPAQHPVGAPADPALADRVAADPVARLGRDPATGQLLLWSTGPEHAALLLAGAPAAPVTVPPDAAPVRVRVHVPRWSAPAVRSDLLGRGAEVEQVTEDPLADRVALRARVPAAELVGYATALSRVSAGTGWYERLPD